MYFFAHGGSNWTYMKYVFLYPNFIDFENLTHTRWHPEVVKVHLFVKNKGSNFVNFPFSQQSLKPLENWHLGGLFRFMWIVVGGWGFALGEETHQIENL